MVCGTEATDHEAEDALPSQSKETHPHLLLRGLSGAKVEIGLATMAYNLKRITTCSVQQIRQSPSPGLTCAGPERIIYNLGIN
jgi:hypothetical protein